MQSEIFLQQLVFDVQPVAVPDQLVHALNLQAQPEWLV